MDLYCRDHHGGHAGRCPSCQSLLDYAEARLARCPYGQAKPTCAKCPVHCYKAEPREQVREVMRYAGPRMAWRHPFWALRHLLDKRRPAPHPMTLRERRHP